MFTVNIGESQIYPFNSHQIPHEADSTSVLSLEVMEKLLLLYLLIL